MHFQHFCFPCICLKSYRRDYMEWKNCSIFYAVAYWRFCSIFNANGKIILIWCIVCCYALEILKNFPFLYREESACSTEKCCRRLKGVWEDYRTTKNDFPLSFWILKSSSLLKNRARSFDYRRQSQHISFITSSNSMALKNVIPFILMLTHVSSCLARSGNMFSPGFVSVSKSLPSWPILSAGTSVTVALVLSLFLTFEHLCAYHQPEVLFFPTLVWFKEFIRVWVAFILEFWVFGYFILSVISLSDSVFTFAYCRSKNSWLVLFWWFQCMLFNQ